MDVRCTTPLASVVAVFTKPVSGFESLTVAPGMTAPLGSVTVTFKVPEPMLVCGAPTHIGMAAQMHARRTDRDCIIGVFSDAASNVVRTQNQSKL